MSHLIGFPLKGVNIYHDMQYVYNKHYYKLCMRFNTIQVSDGKEKGPGPWL